MLLILFPSCKINKNAQYSHYNELWNIDQLHVFIHIMCATCLNHAVGMVSDEVFPRLACGAGKGFFALVVVAQGSGKSVGGVEQAGHVGGINA